jgi:hypothetical protein
LSPTSSLCSPWAALPLPRLSCDLPLVARREYFSCLRSDWPLRTHGGRGTTPISIGLP